MRTVDKEKLKLRHKMMLEYQIKIHPFTPTIRELQELWELNTTSAVHLALSRLEGAGLIETRWNGNGRKYFAKDIT